MNSASRAVTNKSALDPENPVTYRMLGKLVTSSPSRWAAVTASMSAASRAERRSDTRGELAGETAQRELVAVGAKSDDAAHGRASEHRMATLGFTRVDVRDVDLDERCVDRRERVADREARMRVRP